MLRLASDRTKGTLNARRRPPKGHWICNDLCYEKHEGKEGTCKTKHWTYCQKEKHIARLAVVEIIASMEHRRRRPGEEEI